MQFLRFSSVFNDSPFFFIGQKISMIHLGNSQFGDQRADLIVNVGLVGV